MTPDLAARFSLAGRVAMVTGASGVLGARFAQVLAEAGSDVLLAARRPQPMESLCAALQERGARAAIAQLDVTDTNSIASAFDIAEKELGPVDVVVNNSGIAEPAPALDETAEAWRQVFAVNLDGARQVSVEACRRLVALDQPGVIVNVASILGLRQGMGVTAYAASKAALIQMTRQHALEWARHRIRVNALAPGYIETSLNREFFATDAGRAVIKRIPQRRLGRPEELDGALLLLASEAGAFITGSAIVADGGHMLSPL